jgi:hypothetical protein
MKTYWTCSKFADWLRGTCKPQWASDEEWTDWKKEAKIKYPFRYWLAEEGLDKIQRVVCWPRNKIYDIKYYVVNRYISRTHALTAHPDHCPRGRWNDLNHRILPCLFSELVDFVEIELAWWQIVWDDEAAKKYKAPWYARGFWKTGTWRCKQAGIDYLTSEMELKYNKDCGVEPEMPNYGEPTDQALRAAEVLKLYNWWTEERIARPDPYEVSGWEQYCSENIDVGNPLAFLSREETPKEKQKISAMLDVVQHLEQKYEEEDEEMMIRLIKVRHRLWT